MRLSLPLVVRLENAVYAYAMYVWKAFWPVKLAPFYPHPAATLALWQLELAMLFLVAISVLVWRERFSRRYLVTGWLWFLGTLVPVIGLVQVGEQAMADRYPAHLGRGVPVPPRTMDFAPPGAVKVDVVGGVCESSDFLAKDRLLPPVARGDLLAVFSAGAYGFTMSSQYNSRPRAPEVLVEGDTWRIIRRRETYADLFAAEKEV